MRNKNEIGSTANSGNTLLKEPRGFGEHTRGLSGEYAHEQGWGLGRDERSVQPTAPQDTDGGTNYEYGARDFGDEPVNADIVPAARKPLQNIVVVKAAPKRKEVKNG